MNRRSVIKAGMSAMVAAAAVATGVRAQSWPSRPLRMIAASPPGNASDTVLRLVAPLLQAELGQPVVVENRAGASGNIGARACAAAAPDGHTFLNSTNTMLTANPHLFTAGRVDPFEDLSFVLPMVNIGMVFVVRPDGPWKTIGELLDDAHRHPGKLSYGTPGLGSPMHLIGELLKERLGIDMAHLPYKGGVPMVGDVLAGQISVGIVGYAVVSGFLQQGRLRTLAAAAGKRLSILPDTPAIGELVPEASLGAWCALVAPKGTPAPIRARVAREVGKALAQPDIVRKLRPLGLDQIPGDEDAVAALVRAEYAHVGALIKRLGITMS
ncbi:MAG: tripartite tricarboxylate transporter substrate binding protein [Burkholderiaceae bacterium]|nr:tripartite tricarboxylate transporter substrate binding protein [Burkholderiaceae bacterium]